ncbi:protein QUIRKY [Prosopis cineraria]|uniref:protein QUIRKY n=1 Tax=Prosopis cineraria TaxID=364024 RepID=UPI00241065AE|nr:protein QUIRKY [Prosopis cineraria]
MGTVRKLIVEVVDARDLLPKDGHGTSSPYVLVDFYGQRKRIPTVARDLNPTWNETLSFNVGKPSDILGDMLELDVLHDKNCGPTRRNNFLGRVRLSSSQFVRKGEEALIYYQLEKKSLFSWVRGEIGLKIYYVDEEIPQPSPPAPTPAPPEEAKSEAAPAPEEVKSNAKPAPEVAEAKPTSEAAAAEPHKVEESEAEVAAAPPNGSQPENDKATEEPAPAEAPTPENAAPVAEKPVEPEPPQQPTEEGADQVKASSLETSRTMPEVRFSGPNAPQGPQPIRRAASTASFMSDVSDTMSMERCSFDLVEKMHYLFVRVVKARYLPPNCNPFVKIAVSGHHVTSKPARKTTLFEWDQTFAFGRDSPESASLLEVSVWDPPASGPTTLEEDSRSFLGGLCFEVSEIPLRDPPDSPLAPQWYRLEGGGARYGDLMLATWVGTQADEAFPDAWKTDTAGNVHSRAKIYQSPKLWYLRATVLEAQDILSLTALKEAFFQVRAQLGFQVLKSKVSVTRNGIASWDDDLIFVAAEPLSDQLIFALENRQPKGPITMGVLRIPLTTIERRVDDRNVASRWFTFEDVSNDKRVYKGRIHLRLCFDGGYHVMDESAHVCSDFRPTARQLWKPPVGTVELGIISCKNLVPMKTVNGKSSTDAYCVAKYGNKWVRTRTVSDSLDPKWNEQYTWKVFDPCTVLTIGVFDSFGAYEADCGEEAARPDFRVGKVRIRISTLQTGRVYRNTYPLLVLTNAGTKKMGEIEIAIRFVRTTQTLDFLQVYSQPMLPLMHHIKPLGLAQQEMLRNTAVKIVAGHLSRSEPPLRREVVLYMLDADSHNFSMRKVRANWYRIINVVAGFIDILRWIEDTRGWKNPTATILVHALLVMLVWFPDLIIPTLAFYVFVIGAWNYRFRSRDPLPHFDQKMSLAEVADREELDEEFDTVPSSRSGEMVRVRYDKLRMLGARVQTVLGDIAAQGERVQALVTWRDPRGTGIFVGMCLVVALILYLVPSKMVAMAFGFYYLRHPVFRDRTPSPALNFFRRLPSLSDRIM